MDTPEKYWDSRGQVDLVALIARIWRGRLIVIVSVVIFTAAAVMLARVMTPIYRAEIVLTPTPVDAKGLTGGLGSALGSLGGLAALAGIGGGGSAGATDQAIAVLHSREFTEKFMRENDIVPQLYPDIWDKKTRAWTVAPEKQPSYARAYRYFDKSIREITSDKRTGLVTVTIEWRDPVVAANWANDMIAKLNSETRARAIADANAAMGYLEKELGSTSTVETRLAIGRLMEAQVNQRMVASVTQEYSFRVVDRAMAPDPLRCVLHCTAGVG